MFPVVSQRRESDCKMAMVDFSNRDGQFIAIIIDNQITDFRCLRRHTHSLRCQQTGS